jgi:NAD(P)-dependent dehydrogenase (short-subunit alcohol dehydrogenase family)
VFDDLKTKTTLVTGAFGGLGRHFALTLARAGCRVALAGRRTGEREKVLGEIRSGGGDGCVVRLDVRKPESVQRALDDDDARLGPIAVLVNSAGVAVTRPASIRRRRTGLASST